MFEAALEAAIVGLDAPSLDRVASSGSQDAVIAKLIDGAGGVVALEQKARAACGDRGYRLLRAVLGDRQTFLAIAQAEQQAMSAKDRKRLARAPLSVNSRLTRTVAWDFREALEVLAKILS